MEKVKVCVPITGQNQTEIEQQAHAIAATDADVVEWRFDLATALYPSVQGSMHTLGMPRKTAAVQRSMRLRRTPGSCRR